MNERTKKAFDHVIAQAGESSREWQKSIFRLGKYVCASCDNVMLAVEGDTEGLPTIPEKSEKIIADILALERNVSAVVPVKDLVDALLAWPKEEKIEYDVCEACEGEGYEDCKCRACGHEHEIDCGRCDGTGEDRDKILTKRTRYTVGSGRVFDLLFPSGSIPLVAEVADILGLDALTITNADGVPVLFEADGVVIAASQYQKKYAPAPIYDLIGPRLYNEETQANQV